VWVEGWIPMDDSPYLLPHLPLGVGKGVLDCLSIS
jgi:hypothetical protein